MVFHSTFVIPSFVICPMRCPVCKREFDPATSNARPFCSDRCRTIDLGRWLGESYGLPVVPDPEADEVPEEPHANGNGAADERE